MEASGVLGNDIGRSFPSREKLPDKKFDWDIKVRTWRRDSRVTCRPVSLTGWRKMPW